MPSPLCKDCYMFCLLKLMEMGRKNHNGKESVLGRRSSVKAVKTCLLHQRQSVEYLDVVREVGEFHFLN